MPKYVGLDIGSHAVKVAVVRTAYRKTTLEGLAMKEVAASGSLAQAVKDALAEALGGPGAGDGLATALEGTHVAVRMVEVPSAAHRQLAEVLPFEIEAVTPLDMTESVFDHRIMGGGPTRGSATMTVMVAVAKTDDVRARIEQIKELAGVEPERVGVGGFPITQLTSVVPELAAAGPIAVLDLGATGSELVVLVAGEPVYARSLPLGTEGLPGTAPKLVPRRPRSSSAAAARSSRAPSRSSRPSSRCPYTACPRSGPRWRWASARRGMRRRCPSTPRRSASPLVSRAGDRRRSICAAARSSTSAAMRGCARRCPSTRASQR
jgi:general secretion pathway protein L